MCVAELQRYLKCFLSHHIRSDTQEKVATRQASSIPAGLVPSTHGLCCHPYVGIVVSRQATNGSIGECTLPKKQATAPGPCLAARRPGCSCSAEEALHCKQAMLPTYSFPCARLRNMMCRFEPLFVVSRGAFFCVPYCSTTTDSASAPIGSHRCPIHASHRQGQADTGLQRCTAVVSWTAPRPCMQRRRGEHLQVS